MTDKDSLTAGFGLTALGAILAVLACTGGYLTALIPIAVLAGFLGGWLIAEGLGL
jgi:hypothetical protein